MLLAESGNSAAPSSEPHKRGPDPRVFGHQRPRLFATPAEALSSAGQEAVEIAASAGLYLDPWQQYILDQGMGERADGSWNSFEVCVNIPRQNGKGGVIEARELWGLFVGGEELILHSAHEFKTAKSAFKRIERLIRQTPDLHKRVKTYRQTVGEEGIELHSGQLLRFIARSKGSGRGFTGDCNIMDEDMILGDDAMDALMFTMAAVEDPQIWYLGSAGIGSPSVQLARLRRRALEALETGTPDPSLTYLEWSINPHADECPPDCLDHDDPTSDAAALKANPGVGYRLTLEKIANERISVSAEGYARERLGVGDYPSDTSSSWQVIGEDAWRSLAAADSKADDELAFAIDMTPERSHTAISVAGPWRGGTHVEVVDHRPGTGWVLDRAEQLHVKHRPRCWVVDAGGPAGSIIADLADRLGVEVVQPKVREVAAACGQFYDAVAEQSMSHLDQAPLATALAGAQKRALGDAWAWARRVPSVDISPLVSATLAKWGLGVEMDDAADPLDNIW